MPTDLPCCPRCKASPIVGKTENGFFYLECGNLIDCPEWPTTEPLASLEEARSQWIEITSPENTPGNCAPQ